MGRPELFSYLSAFVTIVLALALTNILQSASLLIQERRLVQWDLRPVIFALTVLVALVSEFFSVWWNLAVTGVTMARLLWLIVVPSLFAILAYTALPNQIPDSGLNLKDFFFKEKRLWATMFAIITGFDAARIVETYHRGGVEAATIFAIFFHDLGPYLLLPGGIILTALYMSKGRLTTYAAVSLLLAWVVLGTFSSEIVIKGG